VGETACRAGAVSGEPAGEFAEPNGRTPAGLAREAVASVAAALVAVATARLVPAVAAGDPLEDAVCVADAVACGLECCADGALVAAPADGWLLFAVVDGPKVATESMAPATRHTARMLASSGMTVPVPPNGAVSFRSLLRRRWTRCSRRYASRSRSSSRASSGIWMPSGGSSRPDPPPGFNRHLRRIGPLPPSITPRNDSSCRGLPDASGRLEVIPEVFQWRCLLWHGQLNGVGTGRLLGY
jgi:hypothetical protein